MTDAPPRGLSSPFEVFQAAIPAPAPAGVALHEVTSVATGATLASGYLVVSSAHTPPFTPWYDSVLFLHACDGAFEIGCDGQRRPLEVGGVVWIRSGSAVTFHAQGGTATLVYVVTPADWQARAPAGAFDLS